VHADGCVCRREEEVIFVGVSGFIERTLDSCGRGESTAGSGSESSIKMEWPPLE